MSDEYESHRPMSRRFQKFDLLILGLNLLSEMLDSLGDTLGSLTALVAAHSNYKLDREQFREDAALEIETFTEGDTGE